MDGPNTVRLQRRRNELPPDQLFVERKRKAPGQLDDEGTRGYYIRQKRDISSLVPPQAQSGGITGDSPATQPVSATEARRIFHLKHASVSSDSQSTKSRKRKQNEDLATVVEKRQKKLENDGPANTSLQAKEDEPPASTPSAPLKRPGRGSALKPRDNRQDQAKSDNENIAARQQRELIDLAQEMHQFALDELAKTPKPQIKTKPKLTPSRARALHDQQTQTSPSRKTASKDIDDDTAMDSDSEYVYDTYVLAPAPMPLPTSLNVNDPIETHKTLAIPSNVGYLIITEDDEQLWETYIHDLEGSDSEPTDEDDENAEDYYGADYPSDELATDDEFDVGGAAYGYRARRGSNDEQYNLDDDEDEITWSDEEDMRMMNPFAKKESGSSRVERQFAKYLDRKKATEEE